MKKWIAVLALLGCRAGAPDVDRVVAASHPCTGVASACNDSDRCTIDRCDETASSCVHTNRYPGCCSDNRDCVTPGTCTEGRCVGEPSLDAGADSGVPDSGPCAECFRRRSPGPCAEVTCSFSGECIIEHRPGPGCTDAGFDAGPPPVKPARDSGCSVAAGRSFVGSALLALLALTVTARPRRRDRSAPRSAASPARKSVRW